MVFRIVIAFSLACALSLSGCMAALMGGSPTPLAPEQVRAYQEQGFNVYGCFTAGGPPPAGNTVWIITPKNVAPINARFSDGCHILAQ